MDLLKHQEKIGWQQMKYGRWSLHWDRLQCRYSLSQGAKSQGNEPTWQQKTLKLVMDVRYKRWISRNKAQYPTGTNTTSVFLKDLTMNKIRDMYQHKDSLLAQDQHIFNTPLEQWEEKPIGELTRWIQTHQEHIKVCRQLAAKHQLLRSSDIRRFGKMIPPNSGTRNQSSNAHETTPNRRLHQFTLAPLPINLTENLDDDTMSTRSEPEETIQIQTEVTKYFQHSHQKNKTISDSNDEDSNDPLLHKGTTQTPKENPAHKPALVNAFRTKDNLNIE